MGRKITTKAIVTVWLLLLLVAATLVGQQVTTSGKVVVSGSFKNTPPIPILTNCCTLSPGVVNQGYSDAIGVIGGTPPYTFTLVSPFNFPTGLSLNSGTGRITGTITAAAGTYNFGVAVRDSFPGNPQTNTSTFTIVVSATPPAVTAGTFGMGVGQAPTLNDYANRCGNCPAPVSAITSLQDIFGGGLNKVESARLQDTFPFTALPQLVPTAPGGYNYGILNGTNSWIPVGNTQQIELEYLVSYTPGWANPNALTGGKPACANPYANYSGSNRTCYPPDDVLATLACVPPYNSLGGGNCAYKKIVYDAVRVLGATGTNKWPGIVNWEGWNEPNSNNTSNGTHYLGPNGRYDTTAVIAQDIMQKDLYNAVKGYNSNLRVICPAPQGYASGLASGGAQAALFNPSYPTSGTAGLLQAVSGFPQGLGPYCDVIAYHAYAFTAPETLLNQYRLIGGGPDYAGGIALSDWGKANPSVTRNVWMTESFASNWDTSPCVTNVMWMMRTYILAKWLSLAGANGSNVHYPLQRWYHYQYDHSKTNGDAYYYPGHAPACNVAYGVPDWGTAFASVMEWIRGTDIGGGGSGPVFTGCVASAYNSSSNPNPVVDGTHSPATPQGIYACGVTKSGGKELIVWNTQIVPTSLNPVAPTVSYTIPAGLYRSVQDFRGNTTAITSTQTTVQVSGIPVELRTFN